MIEPVQVWQSAVDISEAGGECRYWLIVPDAKGSNLRQLFRVSEARGHAVPAASIADERERSCVPRRAPREQSVSKRAHSGVAAIGTSRGLSKSGEKLRSGISG